VATPTLADAYRDEWPRILAAVIRFTGSLELAEDAVAEAFARAAVSRERQLLINPAAWVTTVAKRIAIDAVRRDARLRERLPLLIEEHQPQLDASPAGDDRLGLLFVTCTPDLPPETRLALALRFVCGLPTENIADAMLVSHTALSARLTRAKRQIEQEGIRFSPASDAELEQRRDDVLGTVHLLYTIGHTAPRGEQLGTATITQTAIELARALHAIEPADLETTGLLALLLLTEARAGTRVSPAGELITLEHARRADWDFAAIREGLDLAAVALPAGGRFALEAGISGLHCQAVDWDATDWASICLLYDRLLEVWPSPAVEVARIVARSFSEVGADTALVELDALDSPKVLDRQVVAARADILRRLGRSHEARAAYGLARSLERNSAVADYFARRSDELG
jgi:RNA polymerase sigma-70 factor (ECF subfamily)